MNIELITTPNEWMKETGFGSNDSCKHVLKAIEKMGHHAKLNVCSSFHDLEEISVRKPDLVILAVKYIKPFHDKTIWLAEYCENQDLNFTGSSSSVLQFDSEKVSAKKHLIQNGIKTAKYFTAVPGEYHSDKELPLPFPLFLKPIDAANGNGVDERSYTTSFSDFEQKVSSLYEYYNSPTLVEEYLDGREFTVSLIEREDHILIAPIEITPPPAPNGIRILGENTKKSNTETLKKITDHGLKSQISKIAFEAFTTLGVRDFGRIDIKTNSDGHCFFLEANLVPGMTYGSSYFPKACEIEHGYSYQKVVEFILNQGLKRAQ